MFGYSFKKISASPFSPRVLPYLLLIFAVLGFLDASYLTISHYQNAIPPCTIGGCETVLTSNFSTILSVPLSFLGTIYYLTVIVMTGVLLQFKTFALHSQTEPKGMRNRATFTMSIFILCSLGFLVGLILICIQAFVLHAWCYYCLFSELIDFLLFDTAWWLWNGYKID